MAGVEGGAMKIGFVQHEDGELVADLSVAVNTAEEFAREIELNCLDSDEKMTPDFFSETAPKKIAAGMKVLDALADLGNYGDGGVGDALEWLLGRVYQMGKTRGGQGSAGTNTGAG